MPVLPGTRRLRVRRAPALSSSEALSCATPRLITRPAAALTPAETLRDYPRVTVGADVATTVGHGGLLDPAARQWAGEGPWAVLDGDGDLLAVYERLPDGRAKPSVVLAPR